MNLSEVEELLRGVTPGPWWTEPEGTIRNDADGNPRYDLPRFVRYDKTGHTVCKTHLIGGVDPDPALANARFIAWCREGVPALIALATAQAAQIAGLQRTYEELYADALADAKSEAQDFEGDLWVMVRAYLDELHFDWRDFMEDGVTADEAMTHIRECMDEETRRAEAAEAKVAELEAHIEGVAKDTHKLLVAAETEATTLRAEVERLRGALETEQKKVPRLEARLWSIGHAAGIETKADLMETARAALEGKA